MTSSDASRKTFEILGDHLHNNPKKRFDYEVFLKRAVGLWHPTARANRFVLGGVVELMLLEMLKSCGRNWQPTRSSHNQDSFDISFLDGFHWSVKSSFTPHSGFKLVNGLGGSGKRWEHPTVFFVPNFGIVYVDPSAQLVETQDVKDGIKITESSVKAAVAADGSNFISFYVPNKKCTEALRREDHLELYAYEDVKKDLESAA